MNYYPGQSVYESKRVVLITGNSSKWYEQAIFIVKKDAGKQVPTDFVKEAESIIGNYMQNLAANNAQNEDMNSFGDRSIYPTPSLLTAPKPEQTKKKRSGLNWFVNLTLLIACVAIFVMVLTRIL